MRFLAALMLLTSTMTSAGDPNSVVEGWKTSPVYVDPTQSVLVSDEEAAKLAERVKDYDPAIRIAVLPQEALDDGRRDKQMSAQAFVDTVAYKQASDGIYLVVFGDRITWAKAVGVTSPIDGVLAEELREHGRSDPVGTLNGVLDQLDVPKSSSGVAGWLAAFLITVGLLAAGGAAVWWWRLRQEAEEEPAPEEDPQPDTLEERRALAREEVARFGAELDSAGLAKDGLGEEAATDLQAAQAAYAAATRVVDGKPDDDQLRGVRATVGYGRWRLACAQARVEGRPVPPFRALRPVRRSGGL